MFEESKKKTGISELVFLLSFEYKNVTISVISPYMAKLKN